MRKTECGEFLVRVKNSPAGEGYHATSLDDALNTGREMHKHLNPVVVVPVKRNRAPKEPSHYVVKARNYLEQLTFVPTDYESARKLAAKMGGIVTTERWARENCWRND